MPLIKSCKTLVIFFIVALLPLLKASADCDFKTIQHSAALKNIANVKQIEVEIQDVRKWTINGIRTLLADRSKPNETRKKTFRATVKVTYDFGSCAYKARVRQSGDQKDHYFYADGQLVSSLDVRMIEGNVAMATRFKLFLPHTRNGNAEILGTAILSRIGFFAPVTGLVDVSVNEKKHRYIFQEKSAKEMLERNGLREGPILEGDESILWQPEPLKFEPLSLSRVVNHQWGRKGHASFLASLNGYLKLQTAYLQYVVHRFRDTSPQLTELIPLPEAKDSYSAASYSFLLSMMNGWHGLRPHNRKYYFSPLEDTIYPLYYDGNLKFQGALHGIEQDDDQGLTLSANLRYILFAISRSEIATIRDKLAELSNDQTFITNFANAAKLNKSTAEAYVIESINYVIENIEKVSELKKLITDDFVLEQSPSPTLYDNYYALSQALGLNHNIYKLNIGASKKSFLLICLFGSECENVHVEMTDVMNIMATNSFNGNRAVILHVEGDFGSEPSFKRTASPFGEIKHSLGSVVRIYPEKKKMVFEQADPLDWFLIEESTISDWSVEFIGKIETDIAQMVGQRFNQRGITGCVTFKDVSFLGADISASGGGCEDVVNIISSSGSINSIHISTSRFDALDIDFSRLSITETRIRTAGNDCVDLSYGLYHLENVALFDCNDKGVSAGENSEVQFDRLNVVKAGIGLASKDYTSVSATDFIADKVNLCASAYRKKQEFGGAKIQISQMECAQNVQNDEESEILIGVLLN